MDSKPNNLVLVEKEVCCTFIMDQESDHLTLPPYIADVTITLGEMDPNNVITITVEEGPVASNSTITAKKETQSQYTTTIADNKDREDS